MKVASVIRGCHLEKGDSIKFRKIKSKSNIPIGYRECSKWVKREDITAQLRPIAFNIRRHKLGGYL